MDCPACKRPTISLGQWLSGTHSIAWTCPHCDAQLQISSRLVATLAGMAAAAMAVAAVGIYLRLSGMLDAGEGDAFVVRGLVAVAVLSVPAVYGVARTGAYRPR